MHRLSFCAAVVLVLVSTNASAECNGIGCVRPTDGLEKLVKTAERMLFVVGDTKPANALSLCGMSNCATEPVVTPLPENCGRAGCATPEPKTRPNTATATAGAGIHASTLVADAFAAAAEPRTRRLPAAAWGQWAERSGYGGLYNPN